MSKAKAVSSRSDSDGMGSIPANPDALNVPLLLCQERFNEASLPELRTVFIFLYNIPAQPAVFWENAGWPNTGCPCVGFLFPTGKVRQLQNYFLNDFFIAKYTSAT